MYAICILLFKIAVLQMDTAKKHLVRMFQNVPAGNVKTNGMIMALILPDLPEISRPCQPREGQGLCGEVHTNGYSPQEVQTEIGDLYFNFNLVIRLGVVSSLPMSVDRMLSTDWLTEGVD